MIELFKSKNFKILSAERIAPGINMFEVEAPLIALKAQPGQFIILRLHERGERVPLTVADKNPERGTITIVAQEVGKTTRELGTYKAGDTILDLLGPLGHPTHVDNYGTVVVVAGGVGVAEAYPVTKALKEAGNQIISILGFRAKDYMFFVDRFERYSDELIITTNDGSYGKQGFTTDALRELLESGRKVDLVYTVGPTIMMKFVAELTRPYKIRTMASLAPIMLDGTGMCGVCRVTVGGEIKFACVDGPEFDAHLVDFDELMARLTLYKDLERISLEKWQQQVTRM